MLSRELDQLIYLLGNGKRFSFSISVVFTGGDFISNWYTETETLSHQNRSTDLSSLPLVSHDNHRGNTCFSVDSLDDDFSPNITDINEKGGESYKTYDTPPCYC